MYYEPKYENNDPHGTMHLSVIDKDNNAVSLTSTVNLMFGAKFMDPISGVILNDELDDFSIPGVPNNFGLYPSPFNYIGLF
jgi:gamma-glutamyltranspeptidase/glutathione hydrolase/leukotriene-C4 hydrolase